MVAVALASLLLCGDATDERFLLERMSVLEERYRSLVRDQSAVGVRRRLAVVRELAHLPFAGAARERAGALLAKMLLRDRAFRVRAEAARAAGRVGTDTALGALVEGLFGPDARDRRRFELLEEVLPEALARLRRPADLAWVRRHLLEPAARASGGGLFHRAGAMRERLVVLTLMGVGRIRASGLAPAVAPFVRSKSEPVRAAALGALADLDEEHPALAAAIDDPSPLVRVAAARSRRLPPAAAARFLADADRRVRRAAARAMAGREMAVAAPLLIAQLRVENEAAVRVELTESLHELTGMEFGADWRRWQSWWRVRGKAKPAGAVPDRTGRAYFFDVGMRTARVVFVIDVSASMSATDASGESRLAKAAGELNATIAGLPRSARFAVLAFASEVRRFPRNDKPAAPGQAAAAAQWLAKIRPAGGTNTYGALMTAFSDPIGADTVVLLTDGNPHRGSYRSRNYSEHEQILAEVRRVDRGRGIRVHTVGLLTGPSSDEEDATSALAFLRRLARAHAGEFREVR